MTMDDEEIRIMASRKGRSASICAPGFSSMENVIANTSSSTSNHNNDVTPRTRRAKPATRSQSARITAGNKPKITRKTRGDSPITMSSSSCRSEPRLENIPTIAMSNVDSPNSYRRSIKSGGSTRRVNSVKGTSSSSHHHRGESIRKSTGGFLDVPNAEDNRNENEDEESYRLREFSLTSKGVINRGDSFRRRRSRSNSLVPPHLQAQAAEEAARQAAEAAASRTPPTAYKVALLGAPGVGKTALVSQFMTSECINAYDRQREDTQEEESVCIMLNGEESELWFSYIHNIKTELDRSNPPDAFLMMYSVVDKASFQRAEDELTKLQEWELLRTRPALLVGNKVDLARSRAISTQDGRCLACTFRAKFIEISVGINHNVDELLVGILSQIRLKLAATHEGSPPAWFHRNRGVARASMRARQMFSWMFGKEDSKFKNCENLHML